MTDARGTDWSLDSMAKSWTKVRNNFLWMEPLKGEQSNQPACLRLSVLHKSSFPLKQRCKLFGSLNWQSWKRSGSGASACAPSFPNAHQQGCSGRQKRLPGGMLHAHVALACIRQRHGDKSRQGSGRSKRESKQAFTAQLFNSSCSCSAQVKNVTATVAGQL